MKIALWAVRVFESPMTGYKKLVLEVTVEGEGMLHQRREVGMVDWEGELPEMGKIWEGEWNDSK